MTVKNIKPLSQEVRVHRSGLKPGSYYRTPGGTSVYLATDHRYECSCAVVNITDGRIIEPSVSSEWVEAKSINIELEF